MGKMTLIMMLGFIILTAIFQQNNVALKLVVAAAQLSVKPMRDITDNGTQQCQIEERNTSRGAIALRGSSYRTCSIQVNASLGSHILIEMAGVTEAGKEYVFIYIERQGELVDCQNKYVVLNGHTEVCSFVLYRNSMYLNLQGNANILVDGILALDSVHECQESNDNILPSLRVNQTANCNNTKGYNSKFECDLDYYGTCRMDFPSHCNATLRRREIVFQCIDNELIENEIALVVYPIGISILDLSSNTVNSIEGKPFEALYNLYQLYLHDNQLSRLHADAFNGLFRLSYLYLHDNNLTSLPDGLFGELRYLLELTLNGNQLIVLNENAFVGLDLQDLYLNSNKLISLPIGLFRGLSYLLILDLSTNELITLPDGLFEGLWELYILYLSNNNLTTLPDGLFGELFYLYELKLTRNQLIALNENTFQWLSGLFNLYLNNNNLIVLPNGLFSALEYLYLLELSGNRLVKLNDNIFQRMGWLVFLYLDNNKLITLPDGLFGGLASLVRLHLHGNQLVTLNASTYGEMTSLTFLSLHDNNLITIDEIVLLWFDWLTYLSLNNNKLITLPGFGFKGLGQLRELNLHANRLVALNETVFHELVTLSILRLDYNHLKMLPGGLFQELKNLVALYLDNNHLATLPSGLFNELSKLQYLTVKTNQLKSLSANVLQGLVTLRFLDLQNNTLTKLDVDVFKVTTIINFIGLSQNNLNQCPNIKQLTQLKYLTLLNNTLTLINQETFSALSNNSELYVSQHEICECYVPDGAKCSASDNRSPYLTCDRLLSDRALAAMMWIVGINALCGNIFVLVWRLRKTKIYKVQDILLSNLAMSDLLMGIYMITVASADVYYGEFFPMQSESWRFGITCRIAGSLSIASTEASILFICLISIDRFSNIKFPYSQKKLGKQSTIMIALVIWICSLAFGVVPSVLSGRNFKFYDNSHVCIGLPLALTKAFSTAGNRKIVPIENIRITGILYPVEFFSTLFTGYTNGLYYSTALFLGLNCLCFLIILLCYIEIVRAVMKSSKQSGRSDDMKTQIRLTAKVSAIVITDFACWFPLTILGMLVQARVVRLPPVVFAWSVSFVLPVNSAVNPYLYTIAEVVSIYRKNKKKIPETIIMQNMVTTQGK